MDELKEFEDWLESNYIANPHYQDVKMALVRFKMATFGNDSERIENALLITNTGLLIASAYGQEKLGADMDIFSGMLTAINSFVADSMPGETADTSGMNYGDKFIHIIQGKYVFLAMILKGSPNDNIRTKGRTILTEIEKRYGTVFPTWRGMRDRFTGLDVYLRKFLIENMDREQVLGAPKAGGVPYAFQ